MKLFALGEYVDVNQQVMVGEMYVEVLKPDHNSFVPTGLHPWRGANGNELVERWVAHHTTL